MREPTVGSVMTSPVITVPPATPYKDVVALLAGKRISAVPVVDEHGRPLGVVSEADALAKQEFHGGADPVPWWPRRWARWHKASGATAADLMTSPALTIGADEPVTQAARRLAGKRVRRLFVVGTDGAVTGVVSRHDVLTTFLRADDEIRTDVEENVLRRGMWVIPGTVTVAVTDGVVTLDGALDHRSAVQVAERLTQAVTGVVGVHNNLSYDIDDTAAAGL
ncbi:MAG TPA: CBS domain-containing protein [Actinophytocola sp.]|uniref:CBS domain-containing protein n=1 Tax=Actinophytocola sp. TaxID=1872138 RepID=UPI002E02DD25|nr:CBS domain-containing protein [Actinophytocola sp.]